MPVARLVVTALLLCSSSVLAQDNHGAPYSGTPGPPACNVRFGPVTVPPSFRGPHWGKPTPGNLWRMEEYSGINWQTFSLRTVTPTSAEPWRIIPEQTDCATPFQDALLSAKADAMAEQARRLLASIPPELRSQHPWIRFSPDGKVLAMGVFDDSTCYSIHGYQVARDNPNSDSTHPVAESTCLPASRYAVRSAVMNQATPDR